MTQITTFLPTYDSSPEYNAGLLRLCVPLMVKNNISAHPINYAIWYEYAAGNNSNLSKDIDELIDTHTPFNETTSLELYKNHVCNASIESFEKINFELQEVVNNASNSIQDASHNVSNASDKILTNSAQLENSSDLTEVKAVLTDVVAETKQLIEISETLKFKLNNANEEMMALRDELSKAKQLASTDGLTGLLNRRAFDHELSELVNNPTDSEHCLFILDLDHFKKVNDTFGHVMGDKVIRYTAALLKKHAAPHHHAARYGGEEMAVIMPNTSLKEAMKIAALTRESLAQSQLKQKSSNLSIGKITASIGVSSLKNGDSVESFIERADNALYTAKESGRNKVVNQ